MTTPIAYLNGRFLPFTEAALPLHDAGFVSGATVVDNARTFRHKLFRWPDHLERFRRDCATCYVPLDASDEQLTAIAEELIAYNAKLLPPGGELQLITFATPGPLGFYLSDATNGPPTLGMVTYPLPFARYRPFFTEGVTLATVGLSRVQSYSILPPTVKHRSRMIWHITDHKARTLTGNPVALGMTCDDGYLSETSVANFLAVIDGIAVTPPREVTLNSISLQVTKELCRTLGIRCVNGPLTVGLDLPKASEAMLSGTGFCIAGVREMFEFSHPRPLQLAWPGPVFKKLLAAWSDLVGVDIEKQFTETA